MTLPWISLTGFELFICSNLESLEIIFLIHTIPGHPYQKYVDYIESKVIDRNARVYEDTVQIKRKGGTTSSFSRAGLS